MPASKTKESVTSKVLALFQTGKEYTALQIFQSGLAGTNYGTVKKAVKNLKDAYTIHRCKWIFVRDSVGKRVYSAVYVLGAGLNVPHPKEEELAKQVILSNPPNEKPKEKKEESRWHVEEVAPGIRRMTPNNNFKPKHNRPRVPHNLGKSSLLF